MAIIESKLKTIPKALLTEKAFQKAIVVDMYPPRLFICCANIFHSFFHYEMDLITVSKQGIANEIEIKISLSDLKADKNKTHGHENQRTKRLYFAIPESIYEQAIEFIPEHAGINCLEWVLSDTKKGKKK